MGEWISAIKIYVYFFPSCSFWGLFFNILFCLFEWRLISFFLTFFSNNRNEIKWFLIVLIISSPTSYLLMVAVGKLSMWTVWCMTVVISSSSQTFRSSDDKQFSDCNKKKERKKRKNKTNVTKYRQISALKRHVYALNEVWLLTRSFLI